MGAPWEPRRFRTWNLRHFWFGQTDVRCIGSFFVVSLLVGFLLTSWLWSPDLSWVNGYVPSKWGGFSSRIDPKRPDPPRLQSFKVSHPFPVMGSHWGPLELGLTICLFWGHLYTPPGFRKVHGSRKSPEKLVGPPKWHPENHLNHWTKPSWLQLRADNLRPSKKGCLENSSILQRSISISQSIDWIFWEEAKLNSPIEFCKSLNSATKLKKWNQLISLISWCFNCNTSWSQKHPSL